MANSSPRVFQGEAHGAAKLTEAHVRRIRADAARVLAERGTLRHSGLITRHARARRVTVAAVCMAITGRTWAHVPGALPAESVRRGRRREVRRG